MSEKLLRRTIMIAFVVSVVLFGIYCGADHLRTSSSSAPVLSVPKEPLILSCAQNGEEILLSDVSASDREDGDLTERIVMESLSDFDTSGNRTATYAVADLDGNVAKATRSVTYTDYRSPRFALKTLLQFTVLNLNTVVESVGASDVLDGDLSTQIKIEHYETDATDTGASEVRLRVSNSAGDTSRVTVYVGKILSGSGMPQIRLSDYIVYLSTGETFDARTYITDVSSGVNGQVWDASYVDIEEAVDTAVPGMYHVTYSARNENGVMGYSYMTVIVA